MTEKAQTQTINAADLKLTGTDNLQPGMTVRIHEKIKDVTSKGEDRERVQIFEGLITAIRRTGMSRTITVHKMSEGVGVEKIYPINSPIVSKIEFVKQVKVRRAKLTFMTNTRKPFRRALKEKK